MHKESRLMVAKILATNFDFVPDCIQGTWVCTSNVFADAVEFGLGWIITGIVPSQSEMLLQSNTVSHWLGTNLESAL